MPTVDDLPPKPDTQSGQPRPPKAPTVKSSNEKPQPWNPKKVPQPPDGEGPPLEWSYHDARDRRWVFGITVVLLMVFLSVKTILDGEGAFRWVTYWQMWIVIGVAGLFMVWGGSTRLAAGADWLKREKQFVKTYELTSVMVGKDWGQGELVLKDRSGSELTVGLNDLRTNEPLWDLVYNGIQHSIATGAEVNTMAMQKLRVYTALEIREYRRQGRQGPTP